MNLRNNRFLICICFQLLIIVLCFSAAAVSQFLQLDLLIFCCAVLFAVITLLENSAFVIKYAALLITAGLAILGTAIIEFSEGLYLSELRRYSYHTGALPLITAYYLTFVLMLRLFDRKYSQKKTIYGKTYFYLGQYNITWLFLDIMEYVVFAITLAMYIRIALHPAILQGMDRFQYRARYIHGIWLRFANYYFYFIPILLINWHRKKNRSLTVITVCIYVLYLFTQGEKYGNYSVLLLFFMLYMIPPYYTKMNKKTFRRLLILFLIFLLFVFIIVMLQYVNGNGTFRKALSHLGQRLAQQGQLWWSIYDQQVGKPPKIYELSDELAAFTDKEKITPYYGIYKIMYLSAPRDVVTAKIATGSSYTESTAATLYYYFGSIVLPVFAIVISLFFAFCAHKYYKYICSGYALEAIIVTRLILLGRPFYGNSAFDFLFGADTIFTIAIWCLLSLIRGHYGQKNTIACNNAANNRWTDINRNGCYSV